MSEHDKKETDELACLAVKEDKEGKWGGGMTCYVTNQTGRAIMDVSCKHEWDGSQQESWSWMDPGERRPLQITVGGGGHDYWTVRFTDATSSGTWYRNGKQCDVTSGDLNTKQAIYVNLGPGTAGFSIVLPDSSSCLDNYYDHG